jgi:hypothetical protein
MPTGYTASLEEKGYDVRRWLKEDAIRAMGVCIMLRDEPSGLTEAEIKERLLKNAGKDDYHTKRVTEARARLAEVHMLTPKGWEDEYIKAKSVAQAAYDARLAEHTQKKEAHAKAMQEVDALAVAAKEACEDEVVTGTLNFASEQLHKAYDFDYGSAPYRESVLDQSLEDFRVQTIQKLERDIAYHTAEGGRSSARDGARLKGFLEFVQFVDGAK